MKQRIIKVPMLNANDSTATLIKWLVADREYIKAGDLIATVETTKSSIDVDSAVDGYCQQVVKLGEKFGMSDPIAIVTATSNESIESFFKNNNDVSVEKNWTKKAELVAKKLNVDLKSLYEKMGKMVTEADVLANASEFDDVKDLVNDVYTSSRRERVLLIGGGAGGGVVTLDAIFRTDHQVAAGILDENKLVHGKKQMNVPILGGLDLVDKLWADSFFDAAIVVTGDIKERKHIFDLLLSKKIKMTNVIDPSAIIKSNFKIGVGNLILGNAYFSSCVSVGDNNFFASHACIEHHSKVGSHCTFGPRFTTSGAVTIGDEVKCGMGVLIEPYITIGNRVRIPSGAILTVPITSNTSVKIQNLLTQSNN